MCVSDECEKVRGQLVMDLLVFPHQLGIVCFIVKETGSNVMIHLTLDRWVLLRWDRSSFS